MRTGFDRHDTNSTWVTNKKDTINVLQIKRYS